MISKTKKSISLSNSLMEELVLLKKDMSISEFVEAALVYYMNELKKQERRRRDLEIIDANAERFNKEAQENLKFQALI